MAKQSVGQRASAATAAVWSRRPPRRVVTRILMVWMVLVAAYLLWETLTYRGIYALACEWQFEQFGHYLPVLTFGALFLLFASPALLLLVPRKRADDRTLADPRGREAAVSTGSGFLHALYAVAAVLGGAALVTALWSLTVPRLGPPKATIAVGSAASEAPPVGPMAVTGQILYTRTAAFAQDLLVAKRGVRFAPMVPFGSTDPHLVYFVELLPRDSVDLTTNAPAASTRVGVLIKNALPGSIIRLYRYAGFRVTTPYYVLYASPGTVRAGYLLIALQFAVAALIVFVAALLQRRHVRRVARPAAAPASSPAAS